MILKDFIEVLSDKKNTFIVLKSSESKKQLCSGICSTLDVESYKFRVVTKLKIDDDSIILWV